MINSTPKGMMDPRESMKNSERIESLPDQTDAFKPASEIFKKYWTRMQVKNTLT